MSSAWPTKKLGELLIVSDAGIWGSPVHTGNGVFVLRSTNFRENGSLDFGDVAVRQIKGKEIEKLKLKNGDILLEKSGGGPEQPVGRVIYFEALDNKTYIFANFIQRMRPNNALVNSKFLFYYLFFLHKIGYTQRLQSQTTGIRNLNLNLYLKIKIPVLPFPIQQKIVERLDAIKKAQELNDKQIALVEELFQSLLHSELDPKGKNWEMKKLGEVTEIIMGQSPPSSTYNTEGRGLPFFQGKFEFGEIYPIPTKYCFSPIRIAELDDILISVRAPVGNVNLTKDKSCIGRGLAAIRAMKGINQIFLYFFLKMNENNWSKLSVGSTFSAIRRTNLENLKIPLPLIETQKLIVSKLSAVQEYKRKLVKQKELLQELFESTLNKLMKNQFSD